MSWFVYMLKCKDTTLYTGVTTDVDRRVKEHNDEKIGAKYTKARRPVVLAYCEEVADRGVALQREAQIKKMKRSEKLSLAKRA